MFNFNTTQENVDVNDKKSDSLCKDLKGSHGAGLSVR